MRFHFITVVWGDEYTDLYVRAVIPNQLAPGNLPSFKGTDSLYKIYTTVKYADIIKASASFKKLSTVMPAEVILMDEAGRKDKYSLVSHYNKQAIVDAGREGAAMFFLPPDQIYSDGSFRYLLDHAKAGKSAVLIAAVRVVKETLMPVVLEKYFSKEDHSVRIGPREMVDIALAHMHPVGKALFWGPDKISSWPSHIYFKVNDEGILARCFHPCPFMVNPSRSYTDFRSTIDSDYLMTACPDFEKIHVIDDSDNAMAVELDPLAYSQDAPPRKPGYLWLAQWAKYNTDLYQRRFFQKKIRFHKHDISQKWRRAEELSDRVAEGVFYWLRFEPFLISPRMELRRLKAWMKGIIKKMIRADK